MEWSFRKEYPEGELEDEGYCSTRLEFANGKVRAIHRFQRTVSTKTVQLNAQNRLHSYSYGLTVERTFRTDSTSREPGPAEPIVVEYPAIARLVRHRDGSYTAVFRPHLKTFRIARHRMEWQTDPDEKELARLRSPVELRQGSCDAIDGLQTGLRSRQGTQGSFRTLRDTATVAGVFIPYTIDATIRGRWELRP